MWFQRAPGTFRKPVSVVWVGVGRLTQVLMNGKLGGVCGRSEPRGDEKRDGGPVQPRNQGSTSSDAGGAGAGTFRCRVSGTAV